MTQTAVRPINYHYDNTGEVRCENNRGLIFFLHAEPPAAKAAPSWTPVAATKEVEVRRSAEPQPLAEKTRPIPAAEAHWKPVPATMEVEVRRVVEAAPAPVRGTAPLPDVPMPGEEAPKGWFGKLFKK